ncbi:MAG: maleylacetoacetate isomerase [Alphaproteobacteria bacterium]|nr:maleylacetoacetate isomerase [Alphaproteobacteria bacterium]
MTTLHDYFRSSAAFRVRIALALKGLAFDRAFVHLRKGEQASPAYTAKNPQQVIPTLEIDDLVLTQSLAIIEYLDETRPTPPLLPRDPAGRARVRALALAIACEIHPLNNTRVLAYLGGPLKLAEDQRNAWYAHWVTIGFQAIESMLVASPATGRFCHGDAPTLADICLVPQVFNAKRFNVTTAPYVRLMRVFDACMALPAFDGAQPSKQPDAE